MAAEKVRGLRIWWLNTTKRSVLRRCGSMWCMGSAGPTSTVDTVLGLGVCASAPRVTSSSSSRSWCTAAVPARARFLSETCSNVDSKSCRPHACVCSNVNPKSNKFTEHTSTPEAEAWCSLCMRACVDAGWGLDRHAFSHARAVASTTYNCSALAFLRVDCLVMV